MRGESAEASRFTPTTVFAESPAKAAWKNTVREKGLAARLSFRKSNLAEELDRTKSVEHQPSSYWWKDPAGGRGIHPQSDHMNPGCKSIK